MSYRIMLTLIFVITMGCATIYNKYGKHPELTREEKAGMLIGIANSSLYEGNPTHALKNLLEAEKLDSSIPELHHSKALAYFQKHDIDRAIQSAELAVKLNSKFSAANNTLGKLYLKRGQINRAKPYFLKAIKDPLYVEVFKPKTNLGIVYYKQRKWGLAAKQFDEAIQAGPKVACVAHYYKGHLSYRKRKWDQARLEYRRATRNFCIKFPEAHYSLGMAYLKSKQYDKARKKMLEITELFPHNKIADKAMKRLREISLE